MANHRNKPINQTEESGELLMADLSIRDILEQTSRGQIRIPAFQRGFVWDSDRVAYLMDSIYKRYPFGSLLFWRTRERLKFDRKLGPFELPEPQVDYPIDYVLDGQQRITSIYSVFQSDQPQPGPDDNWLPIYFDLSAEGTPQDSQFVALADDKVEFEKHFPLAALFHTVAYRKANEGRPDAVTARIDRMQEIFKEAKIPVQTSTTEEKTTVAIIFERVNRQGVELDMLQLLSAWTWSEEFQLQDKFSDLAEELSEFGFKSVGFDTDLLLRCCSAVLRHDSAPQALMAMNGEEVRRGFDLVTNGIKYAIDYLRRNFKVEHLDNLPSTSLLIPLSVFFAVEGNKESACSDAQRRIINRWFWRASFSRRYSSATIRNLNNDIEQILLLKNGRDNSLGDFAVEIDVDFFRDRPFGFNNVHTKTFILLLASKDPKSFISGQPIDLSKTLKDANRREFHHLMPRAFIRSKQAISWNENVLANFAFLSRADNRSIGGSAPSAYRRKMPPDLSDILQRAIVPNSLFDDDYDKFIHERSVLLASVAAELCEVEINPRRPVWWARTKAALKERNGSISLLTALMTNKLSAEDESEVPMLGPEDIDRSSQSEE